MEIRSVRELPPAMAGVGSAVNDTTRNMGSVLAGAIVVAAGLVVAFCAFRPVRVTAPAEALTETPARVLETTGA